MNRHALPYLAVARVAGSDATAFLHAQLSADVAAIAEGEGGFACYCSPRGQVFGLLLVCRRGSGFLLAGASGLLPGILQRLRMFVLRARVELALADELMVFGLDDPVDPAAGDAVHTAAGLDYAIAALHDAPRGTPEAAAGAWKAAELGHGVVWLEPATSERFIPQMLGFDRLGAVSFTKGCYPGQEIIARARYLGKVKRKPLRLLLQEGDASARLAAGAAEIGSTLGLAAGAERLEATLVDHATQPETGHALLFVVAPETAESVQSVEFGGRNYRCATM